jgi:hypothetical protein
VVALAGLWVTAAAVAAAPGLAAPGRAGGGRSAEQRSPATRADDRAIFPRELAREKWARLGDSTLEFWTPALGDVLKLEERLPTYLRDDREARRAAEGCCPQSDPLWRRAPGYKRQYVGIVRRGHRRVYANFFCEAPTYDWHRDPVDVDDGGDCYFQVEYDVATGRFDNIAVNGGA